MPMTTPAMPGTAMEPEESMDRADVSERSERAGLDRDGNVGLHLGRRPFGWMEAANLRGCILQRQVLCDHRV